MPTLFTTNVISAVLQGVLAIGMIIWLVLQGDKLNIFPLSLGEYAGEDDCRTLAKPTITTVVILLIVFTVITCGTHVYYAANSKSKQSSYMRNVMGGTNPVRWGEYGVTATVMLVAIALLSGVKEVNTLILIIACCVSTMAIGAVVDEAVKDGNKKGAIIATIIGWILLIATWTVIFKDFARAANPEDPEAPKPPAFVWVLVFGMAAMYISFGGIQIFRQVVPMFKKSSDETLFGSMESSLPLKDFNMFNDVTPTEAYNIKTEKMYSSLSMVAKTLLVGTVFSGVVGQTQVVNEETE
jgi:hypothetical protein